MNEAERVCTVSPLLLAKLPPINVDWRPLKEFLLGLGRPWELDLLKYDDNPQDDALFLQASQVIEQQVEVTKLKKPDKNLCIKKIKEQHENNITVLMMVK